MAHQGAVAEHRHTLSGGQRGADRAVDARAGVVGAAAAVEAALCRRHVVDVVGDVHRGRGHAGVDVDHVGGAQRAFVVAAVDHPCGVAVAACVHQSAVLEAPGRSSDAGAAHHHAVSQDLDPVARVECGADGAADQRCGVVGEAAVGHAADLRRFVVADVQDLHRLAHPGGVEREAAAVGDVALVARSINDPRGVGVAAAAGQAAVHKGPAAPVRADLGLAHVHAVSEHAHLLGAAERGRDGAAQLRRVVVGGAAFSDFSRHRVDVVHHVGDFHRLRRRAGVDVDDVVVRARPRVLGAVLHTHGVGVAGAVAQPAVLEAPGRAAGVGPAHIGAVAQHPQLLTRHQRLAQRAFEQRCGVVGLPVVAHRARAWRLVVHHVGDAGRDVGAGALEVHLVAAREAALVARRVFDTRGVGVGVAVAQAAGDVFKAPAGARGPHFSNPHPVAVDRHHFVGRQRFAHRAPNFGLAVVGAASVAHVAGARAHVVFHARDRHRLGRRLGVDVDGVAVGDRSVVARQVGHPRGVGVAAAAEQSAVVVGPAHHPVVGGDGGCAYDHSVSQHLHTLARAQRRRQAAPDLRCGVVGEAVVRHVAFHRRLVVRHRRDAHRLGRRAGVHTHALGVLRPGVECAVDHAAAHVVGAVVERVGCVVQLPGRRRQRGRIPPGLATVQAHLHPLTRAQRRVRPADDQRVVVGHKVATRTSVFADRRDFGRGRRGLCVDGQRQGVAGDAFIARRICQGVSELTETFTDRAHGCQGSRGRIIGGRHLDTIHIQAGSVGQSRRDLDARGVVIGVGRCAVV